MRIVTFAVSYLLLLSSGIASADSNESKNVRIKFLQYTTNQKVRQNVLLAYGSPPPNAVHSMFGARFMLGEQVLFDWEVAVQLFSGETVRFRLNDNSIPIYLNGEKFNAGECTPGWEPHREFLRWYSFTGYCKVEKKGEGYNFVSLKGKELEEVVESVGGNDTDLYTAFTPRLTSLKKCRRLWLEENQGQIHWNESARKYEKGPRTESNISK